MTVYQLLVRCACCTVFLVCDFNLFAAEDSPATAKPNILFIMVDDMGYSDLGVTGSRNGVTHYLDRLASEGVLLTNAYANGAICSPTRTALLAGKYQHRFEVGLPEPIGPGAPKDIGLPLDQPTIASEFKQRGYSTHLIGKWHLGAPPEHSPMAHGYDSFFGIIEGAADYFHHKIVIDGKHVTPGIYRDNELVEPVGYMTTLLADEAVKVIEQKNDQPLFISLHFTAPHWPWEGPFDDEVSRQLKDIFHRDGGSLHTYAEMMQYMDSSVGRVLSALEKQGLSDDTLVVFTSDNGAERYSETWPFTGYKGSLLEGGIRVPIIVRWPGRITAGSTSLQMMMSMDFLPTLIAATGEPVAEQQFDGVNLLPVLTGEQGTRDRTFFWRHKQGQQAAVRQGEWKYFKSDGKEWLFNVHNNPHERAQLKDKHPQIFAELKALWEEWNQGMLPYPENSESDRVADDLP